MLSLLLLGCTITLTIAFTPISLVLAAVCLTVLVIVWVLRSRLRQDLVSFHAYVEQLAQEHSADEPAIQSLQLPLQEINVLRARLQEAARSIEALAEEGGLPEFTHLTTEQGLGQALLLTQKRIRQLREKEAQRTWVVEGIAKFAELVRQEFDNQEEYCYQVLRQLIKYLNCNQGGFFVVEESEEGPTLVLKGAYAFDRRKYLNHVVYPGQGLLGQVMYEKELIVLTDIPENFVSITSGLGEASPRNIVLVPLLLKDDLFGVIELASFHVLPSHHRDFLMQLGENIAATLGDLSSKQQMRALLAESQNLAQELKNQEQEVRQNLEELQATQEQMQRKQAELDSVVMAVNQTLGMAEVSQSGKFRQINDRFLMALGIPNSQRKEGSLFDYWDRAWFDDEVLPRLKQGRSLTLEHQGKRQGAVVWWHSSFAPILDLSGSHRGTMILLEDITQRKQRELEFERLSMVADNTDNSVIITDRNGLVEFVNDGFSRLTGFTLQDMLGKKPGALLQGKLTDGETVSRISQALKEGQPVVEEILNYTKDGKPYWVSLVINPVRDEAGELHKFIAVQAEITATKTQALEFHSKLDALDRTSLVCEISLWGEVTTTNRLFADAFGMKDEELVGQRVSNLMPDIAQEGENSFWQTLIEGKLAANQVFAGKRPDKKPLWLRGTFGLRRDFLNRPEGFLFFANDITSTKVLEQENLKNQAELQSTFKAINHTLASCTFSLQGEVLDANPIFTSIVGYPTEDLVGRHYKDLLPQEERDHSRHSIMWDDLREGRYFNGEFTLRDCHDKVLWFSGTYSAIVDQNDVPQKVVMIAHFITHDKEKRKELDGALSALKATLPMLEIKPNGQIKSASALFMEQFGISRREVTNQPLVNLVPGLGPSQWKKLEEQLHQLHAQVCNWGFQTPQGPSSKYRVTLYPIQNLEGGLSKIIALWERQGSTTKSNASTHNPTAP